MANLSIRKIDEETMARLRMSAARHGVSMEEEVRRIIKKAVSEPQRLGDLALQWFGPSHGVNVDLPEHKPHDPVDLFT
jgi:plasmid stability protein